MISAVVLTKNSQLTLNTCLKSLNWCDEILVIDDLSSDNTVEIAKKYCARVIIHELKNNFAKARNIAISIAKNDWLLYIDSDEEVSSALAHEIQYKIKNKLSNGYSFLRTDILFGKALKHGETAHSRLIRLGKKNAGYWHREVHEYWEIKGHVSTLRNPLIHHPHQTIREFLDDINRYSTIHARIAQKEGHRATFLTILGNPSGKFLRNYFIFFGLLDGIPGIVVALMMSLHSFLAQAKLWKLQQSQ